MQHESQKTVIIALRRYVSHELIMGKLIYTERIDVSSL